MDKSVRASASVTSESKVSIIYTVSGGNASAHAAAIADLISETGLGVVAEFAPEEHDYKPLLDALNRRFNIPVRLNATGKPTRRCVPGEVVFDIPNTVQSIASPSFGDDAFMQAPIAMTITDQHGVIQKANLQMSALSGYRTGELEGQFVGMLFSPDILSQIAERHHRLTEGGNEEPALFSLIRQDGTVRIVAMASRLYRAEEGTEYKITTLRDHTLEFASDTVNLMLLRQDLGRGYEIPKPTSVFASNPNSNRIDGLLLVRAHAIWDLDLVKHRLFRSEGFTIQFGMPSGFEDYAIGEPNPHIHPEDQREIADSFKAFLEDPNELFWQKEYRHGVIDGHYQTVLDAAYVFRDAEGKAYRLVGVSHNVTIRRKLENLQTQASELARNGSWEVALPSLKLYWSPEVFAIHEVEGDVPPPIENGINFYKEGWAREQIRECVERAIHHGEGWDLELPIVTAKGNERWVRTICRPQIKNGQCVSLSGSFQDIDRIKRAQIELHESNERFLRIADVTNEAIYDWNIKTDELYWGRGFETVFGYNSEVYAPTIELWTALIHPDDEERVSASLTAAIEDPQCTRWVEEYRYKTSDGNYLYCIDQGGFVRNEAGEAIRMVGSVQDISASKAFEEALVALNKQLAQQTQQLEASNKELEQFAYIASHDLQEPLRMVSSFLSQIERRYGEQLDDRGREYIGYAVDGAQRMKNIIQDLLNYARVTRFDEPVSRIDLNELVRDVVNLHRANIDGCNAEVEIGQLPVVHSYKSPWAQILNNLIGNALKYRKPDGLLQIRIYSTQDEQTFSISISDTGIGIDPAHSERIFGIFQRLHKQDQYPGTGIGLSLVKKLTENFGGKITVESVVGEGSTFTLTLPNALLSASPALT